MIISYINTYRGEYLKNRFSFGFFKEKTLRIGNIISFISSVEFEFNNNLINSDKSINFCWEIPDINAFSNICFSKLFNIYVGDFLGKKFFDSKIEVNENRLILHKEHNNDGIIQNCGILSNMYINHISDTGLGYINIFINAGKKASGNSFSCMLEENKCQELMNDVNKLFYETIHSLFLESFMS